MRIPPAVTVLVAVMVIAFGVYRIVLSRRSDEADERARQRGGLYGRSRRTHLLFGIVYLLLGAFLIAALFGYNPFSYGRSKAPAGGQPARDRIEVR